MHNLSIRSQFFPFKIFHLFNPSLVLNLLLQRTSTRRLVFEEFGEMSKISSGRRPVITRRGNLNWISMKWRTKTNVSYNVHKLSTKRYILSFQKCHLPFIQSYWLTIFFIPYYRDHGQEGSCSKNLERHEKFLQEEDQ